MIVYELIQVSRRFSTCELGCSICCTRFYEYSEHPRGFLSPGKRGNRRGLKASSPATLGAKRRFRSEYGERKLAEMTIFADRCCPCGEVKAKKEYQEGGDLSAPYGAPLISHPSSLLCHCRFRGIAGEDAHVPCGCSLMKYADKKHSLFRYIILNTLITNRKKLP